MSSTEVSKEKLVKDFNTVIAETEQLLKTVAAAGGEKTVALRESVEHSLKAAKERLSEFQETAAQKAKLAVRTTDEYVHGHPWQSIAIVAGVCAIVGVVIGLLLNRRA
jgi:ElaB/YqjD/DUF883 family membrane-anchored ribosome-binding protein